MAQPSDQVVDQIAQLNAARTLVLGDAAFYPQIIQGVLPIIGANARLELRRWGAEFLAETFANPALASSEKEQLAAQVLQSVRSTLEQPEGDSLVLRYLVETMASLYPLVFRHIINHPEDGAAWENVTAIKHDILRRWDSFPFPAKVCCIKFVQRVVQVQTHGSISDPRRPEHNETSLAIVPRNHAVLSLPNLEAEASGLLDRLLSVFQEESNDPLLVNATLNCLAILVRTRQSVGNKIIDAVINFIPAKQVSPPITPTMRVGVKSMERTARALVSNILKRNPNHPLAGKMQQYRERLNQSTLDTVDESSRKRSLPSEPTDGLDSAKRARLEAETPLIRVPTLPSGPISYQQLYTLTEDAGLSSFDVKQLPADLLVKIVIPVLTHVNQSALHQAVDAVRMRYQSLPKPQAPQPSEDEDDDYEPEYEPMDVAEAGGQPDGAVPDIAPAEPDLVSLGPFVLPQPPALSEDEAFEIGQDAVARVFGMLASAGVAPAASKGKSQQQLGFARLAGSTFDRDAWVTLLARLATRAPAGLEGGQKSGSDSRKQGSISNSIREMLYRYVLEDFRGRVNVGIMWLSEEWYNDRIQMQFVASQRSEEDEETTVPLHYDEWVLRLLDGFLPYLDARDMKIFIRFLSEIPEITIAITKRVGSLAKDPERVNLCVQSLLYLIMFRPPAREMCLTALEDVYHAYEESRPAAGKILARWRPQSIEAAQPTQSVQPEQKTQPVQAPQPSQSEASMQPRHSIQSTQSTQSTEYDFPTRPRAMHHPGFELAQAEEQAQRDKEKAQEAPA